VYFQQKSPQKIFIYYKEKMKKSIAFSFETCYNIDILQIVYNFVLCGNLLNYSQYQFLAKLL